MHNDFSVKKPLFFQSGVVQLLLQELMTIEEMVEHTTYKTGKGRVCRPSVAL